jgi:hypothetical protein
MKENEKDYRTAEGISYSSLSRLADGPDSYINKPVIEGDFLDNGSAVDILLTEGDEAFHKEFYIMTENKPSSDMMLAYVNSLLSHNTIKLTDEMHATALADSGYKSSPIVPTKKDPTGPTKYDKEGKKYFAAVLAAGDKKVLDFEQNAKIRATVNQLRSNPFTAKYFEKDLPDHIEIIYQFTHYWDLKYVDEVSGEVKTRKAKLKADILVVDHHAKHIYGKDLKTTGKHTEAFRSSYRTYKYYLQEGLYQEGIIDWAEKNYPEYEVQDFEFIVAQMGAFSEPLIYTVGPTEHGYNLYGGETGSGYFIKGVAGLLEDLEYYESMNAWHYKKEVVENNGRINLELFK